MKGNVMELTDEDKKKYLELFEKKIAKALADNAIDEQSLKRFLEDEKILHVEAPVVKELKRATSYWSTCGYPKSYNVKDISRQVATLRRLFPGIGGADEKIAKNELPPKAEGWFAIPRWELIGRTYIDAVEKALRVISTQRKVGERYALGNMQDYRLRQMSETAKMWKEIGKIQKGYDILIVPAQFGLCYREPPNLEAKNLFDANEFYLGVFAVSCMLLTHPMREQKSTQLHTACVGDEIARYYTDEYSTEDYLVFKVRAEKLNFFSDNDEDWIGYSGAVTAFLVGNK